MIKETEWRSVYSDGMAGVVYASYARFAYREDRVEHILKLRLVDEFRTFLEKHKI